jgi:two-component system, NtrC family, nitrogen regulation sensor histidine kinase NtrY
MRAALALMAFFSAQLLLIFAVLSLHARSILAAWAVAVCGALLIGLSYRYWIWHPLKSQLKGLNSLVSAWRDQEFSTSITRPKQPELIELTDALNQLGDSLRLARVGLVQRELLLDTLVQNTPTAMVLVDASGFVVVANLAARTLLNSSRRFEGRAWVDMLRRMPQALADALLGAQDGLVTVPSAAGATDEIFHLSQREFSLQARPHQLILLRRVTQELSRQEVAIWKNVIRVMSHEINNSLAPISSMAHSGTVLLGRGQLEPLPKIFSTISERSGHLAEFIGGYARVAKLPLPQRTSVQWCELLARIPSLSGAGVVGEVTAATAYVDGVQIEQLLINLVKNALEAGSVANAIVLSVCCDGTGSLLSVADRGSGMTEAVMASALLPFYSTKRSGTGLGLALAREIAEAHGGRLSLRNQVDGGLLVRVFLPGDERCKPEL